VETSCRWYSEPSNRLAAGKPLQIKPSHAVEQTAARHKRDIIWQRDANCEIGNRKGSCTAMPYRLLKLAEVYA
jgi:hypothetical protein